MNVTLHPLTDEMTEAEIIIDSPLTPICFVELFLFFVELFF